MFTNVDYPGNDLTSMNAPDAHPACNVCSFMKSSTTCYLKSTKGTKPSVLPQMSSLARCIRRLTLRLRYKVSAPCRQAPISQEMTSLTRQRSMLVCAAHTPGCRAYSWSKSHKMCWLKTTKGGNVRAESDVHSGGVAADDATAQCAVCSSTTCYLKSSKGTNNLRINHDVQTGEIYPSTGVAAFVQGQYSIQAGTNFPGNDILNTAAADVGVCCDLCRKLPSQKMCWLKTTKGGNVHAEPDVHSGEVAVDHRTTQCGLVQNVDYPGNDIVSMNAADAGVCCDLCRNNPACTLYAFVKSPTTCYLKSSKGTNPIRQRMSTLFC
ncbi:TPA: hypothetical protein N0F65_010867 [Lagenidium giganteum]|uniref:Apple domain-containing protein n=1 Tax=Lagenidium giganteum TaxID=4803 RepID=A0AAV2Z620_9STRA|nr:TPA: hypothetical protein N0F65_010867 [Lagenidium giganteum]